jgi:hypothetical protein
LAVDAANARRDFSRMKKFSLLVVLALSSVALQLAGAADKPSVEVVFAKDQESKPTDTFPADVPKIYAFFRSTGTKSGDKIRGVWIAEDVGTAAPKETKIDESALTADKDNFYGAFSLSKPTAGWPVGKYRVEIYHGDALATTGKFTVTAAAAKKDATADDEKKDVDND